MEAIRTANDQNETAQQPHFQSSSRNSRTHRFRDKRQDVEKPTQKRKTNPKLS